MRMASTPSRACRSAPTGFESTVAGFQTYVQNGIVLRVNDHVQIDVTMKVGAVSERVEVTANAGLVQTQQNTISQVVDQQRIVDLPLNGRDPTQLITISGASVNHSDGTNTGSKSFFSSQSISIAGSAGNATNYLLDGGDNNDSFTNVNMPFPFPDALAEFSVETSTLPARNGLHPGGVVNAVTKSGSNRWHGDLFEFIRNGDVNAINYFAPKQDSLKRNQFGGTFGGRIIRDKLFFFGGLSRIRHSPGPVLEHRVCSHGRGARRRFQCARWRRLPVQGRGSRRSTIPPRASPCRTARLVRPASIPCRWPSPSTCRRRRIPAARFPTASRCNPTKASSWDASIGSSTPSTPSTDAICG